METTVTTKGQIVIPSSLRRKYGIKVGTRVVIEDDGEKILLWPITQKFIKRMQGSLEGSGLLQALGDKPNSEGDDRDGKN